MRIKDFLLAQVGLYKYTWKVVVCIVIIDKGQVDLDIWPETPN